MCKVLTGYFFLIQNSGDDADTTGAIYGRLARVYYGEDGIPET
jgi:ADP-ribosylglycohydrolase